MPRKKRFTPVSHDFNRDPQVITLRKDFGDWAALAWIECLGIADRNDGIIPGTLDEIARILAPISLQMYIGRAANAARTILERFIDNSWITQGYLTDASRTRQTYDCVQVVNHWKYHRSPEHKKEPSEPNPNHNHNLLGKEKNKRAQAPISLPDWLPKNEWDEFVKNRKRKRAGITPEIAARIIAVIDELREAGYEPAAVLNKAVDRNWTSIEFDWIHKQGAKHGHQKSTDEPDSFDSVRGFLALHKQH